MPGSSLQRSLNNFGPRLVHKNSIHTHTEEVLKSHNNKNKTQNTTRPTTTLLAGVFFYYQAAIELHYVHIACAVYVTNTHSMYNEDTIKPEWRGHKSLQKGKKISVWWWPKPCSSAGKGPLLEKEVMETTRMPKSQLQKERNCFRASELKERERIKRH